MQGVTRVYIHPTQMHARTHDAAGLPRTYLLEGLGSGGALVHGGSAGDGAERADGNGGGEELHLVLLLDG